MMRIPNFEKIVALMLFLLSVSAAFSFLLEGEEVPLSRKSDPTEHELHPR